VSDAWQEQKQPPDFREIAETTQVNNSSEMDFFGDELFSAGSSPNLSWTVVSPDGMFTREVVFLGRSRNSSRRMQRTVNN